MRAVEDGGCACRGDEADEDEDGAADSRLVLCVAVGVEDLVCEGGEGVEEADVGGEGEQEDVEG